MKNHILIAFILNLGFSVFELVGGILTGSVAILSDSLHDFGDALSIGIAFLLEKKSAKKPDNTHTYGYLRYSVLGSVITTVILLVGSVLVIVGAFGRILKPTEINYNGMIIFAVIGAAVNFVAAYFTHGSESLNEKAVNLHMLEDVLGWVVVLIGAVVMKFTDIIILDSLLSIGVAVFILIHALKNLFEALNIFLNKTPKSIKIEEMKKVVLETEGVLGVHHIHVFSLDGVQNIATLHVVTNGDYGEIKHTIKHKLEHLGITHTTVELENENERCGDTECTVNNASSHSHHHHH
ncbi:MAG: cation transporter [Clostridia bacterium]|nr:cation transporter [Clostridia bacterium]